MIEVIIGALLPILVMFVLGYFAGAHHDFNRDQAAILNRMVMLYALPLSLFSGLVTISLDDLVKQADLAIGLFIGMVGFYFIVYLLARFVFHRDNAMAALLALAITGPAVPFVGISVLADIFGNLSTIPISLGSTYLNLIQVPLTMIIITMGAGKSGDTKTGSSTSFLKSITSALKEPVVWAPLLALVFVILKVKFPTILINSFELLGKATGGVALFASGVILYSYKVALDKTVAFSVIAKNLLVPFAIWGVVALIGFNPTIIKETVLTVSIPTGSIVIMLALQYKTGEKQIASILFLSSALSIITMGIFMWLLG